MRNYIVVACGIIAACQPAFAQKTDSSGNYNVYKSLLLREVYIQPGKSVSQSNEELQTGGLQALSDQILERNPGINMIRRGNFAMEPSIRSLSGGRITMTIDGMRVFGACTDRMDPVSSYIEPTNLESILVSFSPGEDLHGTSIGGGVDFKLKEPKFTEGSQLNGMLGSGFESNGNAGQLLAGIEYSNADFAFHADGIYRRSSNYHAGKGTEVFFSQYKKWNGNISVKAKTGTRSFIKADYVQDEGRDIGYPALTMDVGFAKAKIAALSYMQKDPETHTMWETKVYYNFIDHAMDDTRRPVEQVAMHMDMPGTSRTFGAFSSISFKLREHHYFKLQLDGFSNKLSAEMTMYPENAAPMFMYTLPDPARTSIGFDFSDKVFLNSHTSIKIGGRLEYLHDFLFTQAGKDQVSGLYNGDISRQRWMKNLSIQGSFHVSPLFDLSAQVAAGARAPTLQEEYSFYIYDRLDGHDYIGNPQLKQEKSINLDLNANFHTKEFKAETNVFSYFLRDYITGSILPGYSTMTIGANGVKQFINIPSARLYGAALVLSWSPFPAFNITSTNTYTRGTDHRANALPLIAPLKSVNTVSFQAGRETIFHVESVSNARQNRVNTELYGETPTKGSTILNFGASRNLLFTPAKVLKLSGGVTNLLDSQYSQHLDIMKVLRPGRNFFLRMTLLF
ncbi:TonB-dependent receptor plug domain-containing protein [Arcticibacter tournemirensis]|uniref:TonB-dependent receptor n=1 Tax=Arcticibacter tournemirensis TaxID=699437 RepID=A0A4Q0M6L1_9SPHI|nr:TonB-dependent receptor [Arcticibacter tournemirensis]RXF68698.1 TonB-dependent receptor [Arcticibacter tournemirensis]